MKKRYIIPFICIFLLVGCSNKEEISKSEYINMKSNLLEKEKYTEKDNLPLDITIKIDRIDKEKIKYKVILSNPKENMKNIKAMVIHNYYTEELFPSIGIFDEKKELLTEEKNNTIELENNIKTTKNISKLNLELKVWIEYTNNEGKKQEIFYKTT